MKGWWTQTYVITFTGRGFEILSLYFVVKNSIFLLFLKNSRWQICSIFIIFYQDYLHCDTCHTCSKWPGNISVSLISMHINLSKYMHMYTYPWYFMHTRSTGTADFLITKIWNCILYLLNNCEMFLSNKLLNGFWLLFSSYGTSTISSFLSRL